MKNRLFPTLCVTLLVAGLVLAGCRKIETTKTPAKPEPKPIVGIGAATRLRLTAGANGDFHLAGYIPASNEIRCCRYHDGKWQKPITVAKSKPVHYADIAADAEGRAYLVWVTSDRKQFFLATVQRDGKVTLESRKTRGWALRAEVVVDTLGYVRAVYREKQPEELVFLSRKAGAGKWQSVGRVPIEPLLDASQRRHSLLAGTDGKTYCAYRFNTKGKGDVEAKRVLRYRAYDSKTGKWSGVLSEFRGQQKPWGPTMFMDSKGRLHMVWYEGYHDKSRLVYRNGNGEIVTIGQGYSEDGFEAAITATEDGNIVVVRSTIKDFRNDKAEGSVHCFIMQDGKFSSPVELGKPDVSSYGAAAAYGKNLMLAWSQENQVRYSLNLPNPPRNPEIKGTEHLIVRLFSCLAKASTPKKLGVY
ncbi:MAG: hypothetical protein KAV00_10235 [Phycisphaerae bacterium]|nr:hypothetical protein [Phycisphaerae bacterium]